MAQPVLEVRGLSFAHAPGEDAQVRDVTFALRRGRTLGLLGGNECGKTTLAHLILGALAPASGTVRVRGEPARRREWPLWIAGARGALLCLVCAALLLGFMRPSLLAHLRRSGAYVVPCALVLLEAGYQCRRRRQEAEGSCVGASVQEGWAPPAMRRRGVAYISSEHDAAERLPAAATIEEVISRHMPLPASARAARRREVIAALRAGGFQMYAESGMPVGNAEQYVADGLTVAQLSAGQRQLVYILSVLGARPEVLIADEILCGLDIDRQASVLHMLQGLQVRFGLSILYMSVDLPPVELMAHECAFMHAGRLTEHGDAAGVLGAPKTREARLYVMQCREAEEASRGKNVRTVFTSGRSVFS